MLVDKRIEQLAYNLVNYSCRLQKGEKVLIEAFDIDYQLVACIVREAFKVGAYPFVETFNNRITRELLIGGDKQLFGHMAKYASLRMGEMDAYIGIRGGSNALEHSDVPSENMRDYVKYYSHPVHHELRVKGTKWVVLRYPTLGMAQQSGMSTEAFEDLYFNVCNLDYSKMDKAMDSLKEILDHADKVRIVGPGKTDLSFSIKGIGSVKCSGHLNIPDGEIYTAPVRDSVNGVIEYNTPSIEDGFQFENVCLTFKDGKIIDIPSFDIRDGAIDDIKQLNLRQIDIVKKLVNFIKTDNIDAFQKLVNRVKVSDPIIIQYMFFAMKFGRAPALSLNAKEFFAKIKRYESVINAANKDLNVQHMPKSNAR